MREALEQVYQHSRDRLLAVASRYADRDAEDIVQDAFVRALRHGDEFRSEAAPLTWLHRIVVNACLDHRRRNHRRQAALSLLNLPRRDVLLPVAAEALSVRQTLSLLHPTQVRILVLYEVAGYTHREIAELL